MSSLPVWVATFPLASTIPTCRTSRPGSPASSACSVSGALRPARISASPNGP
jgi:hypothetical protein